MARPTKRTPETEKAILDALRTGNTRRASALYAGIDQRTFERWCNRYAVFAASVEKAEADAEVGHVARIAKAAKDGTWQAAAWWLERRRHDDWAKRDELTINIVEMVRRRAEDEGLDPAEVLAETDAILKSAR